MPGMSYHSSVHVSFGYVNFLVRYPSFSCIWRYAEFKKLNPFNTSSITSLTALHAAASCSIPGRIGIFNFCLEMRRGDAAEPQSPVFVPVNLCTYLQDYTARVVYLFQTAKLAVFRFFNAMSSLVCLITIFCFNFVSGVLVSFCHLVSIELIILVIFYHPSLMYVQTVSNFPFQIFLR